MKERPGMAYVLQKQKTKTLQKSLDGSRNSNNNKRTEKEKMKRAIMTKYAT